MKGRPPPTLAEATPYIYSITIIYVNYNKNYSGGGVN